MKDSLGIIGGADGPTAIFVTGGVGHLILPLFLALVGLLILLVCLRCRTSGRRAARAVFYGVCVVAFDQYVKFLISAALPLGGTADILPPLVQLRRVHNYGAAWSSLSGARWLLIAVTAVGLGALLWLLIRIVRHPLGVWSLSLVIAGGVGNLIDRVRLGYVVDMLEFMFLSFPVFNVADIFVTCGTIAAV
ncbi:MAG: signal peptidase II, partial [Oscillospiraceae bacterium]|nr:signal peptidase II [Oscillospiraceae bacterium]